jgi:kumamolisin
MPPILRRSVFLVFALCAALLATAAGAQDRVVLPGHVTRRIAGSTKLSRAPSDEKVNLSLVVNVDQTLLDQTLAELYGPNSPKNKKFLSASEFARRFGLAAKRRALKDFARNSGLTVDADDRPNSQVVRVTGSSSLVEKAFGVNFYHYRAASGQVFTANDGEPSIPAALAPHLHAVLGLSNYHGAMRPRLHRFNPKRAARPAASGAAPRVLYGTGKACYNGSGGVQCALSPADIKTIYGLTSGVLTGSGQKIALLELDSYAQADVNLYEQNLFSSPYPNPTVGCYSIDSPNSGGQTSWCGYCGAYVSPSNPGQNQNCDATTLGSDDGMIEVALDIDMAIALSPGAAEIMVYTTYNGANSYLIDAYAAIASDDLAGSVSTSWGEDEQDAGSSLMSSENAIFKQMAAQGQSMFSAAGDDGPWDAAQMTNSNNQYESWDASLITDDPASQPYVTGVGGTSLTSSTGGPSGAISESVWNNGCYDANDNYVAATCTSADLQNGDFQEAGGGGVASYVSGYWSTPSYQAGVSGADQSHRNVPDVSLNADPDASPYSLCVGGSCTDATNDMIGGTSAAAPLWASLTALVNQKRAANGYSTLGFANPSLYALAGNSVSYANDYNDIKDGSSNGYYTATTGYDNASGWGSFKANALISQLSSPSTTAISGGAAYLVGVSSIEWTWTAAPDTSYNVYYATQPTQALAVGIQPPYVMSGLHPDATAYIVVYSTIASVQGTSGLTLSTATYAEPPTAAPTATGFASSATFTYSACPAFPALASCSGYVVQVAPTSNFTGTTYSSATPNAALTTLSLTGLSGSSYYARLGTLNPGGAPSFGPSVEFFLNAVAPGSPSFPAVSTGTITFQWTADGNPVGISYTAQISTAPDFTGAAPTTTGTGLTAAFGGLAADTSYYFRVQGSGGPYLDAGPQATLPVAPGAASPAFSAVGAAALSVAWTSAGNAADAAYEADLSLNANFTPLLSSTVVTALSASFSGLTTDTAYYARVRALGRTGANSAYLSLGSTTTLTAPPTFGAQPFSAVGTGSFTVSFNSGGNPAGTAYVVQASTNAGFATLTAQQSTTGTSATFSGLWSNATYYVQVAALNSGGSESAFTSPAASTATLAGVASPGAAPFGASASSLELFWSAPNLAPGTTFYATVSATLSPFTPVSDAQTAGDSAALAGLAPDTTYYGEVQALSNSSDPNGAAVALGAGATLALAPASASFGQVYVSSLTVAWTSGGAAEGYRVDLSTSPSFSTLTLSVTTGAAATSALVAGLYYDTTFYARVGALNWQSKPNYTAAPGTAVTGAPIFSTGTTTSGPLLLSLGSLPPPLISVTVTVPAGAFPSGTDASAIAGFFGTPLSSLTGAASNEAPITPLGSQAAFCVSASPTCLYSGGPQPSAPVLFSIAYNPAELPVGFPESSIQLMRYDPTAAQWTLVASQDDPSAHVLTAYTQHFSLFAPFFLTPATSGDVTDVQIFPQPWELGAPGSAYFASVLTFASLPAGASVKLFTLAGELVWQGSASGSGVATWDGSNRFGRSAASGTYLVVIESGGTKRLRRVVLIR